MFGPFITLRRAAGLPAIFLVLATAQWAHAQEQQAPAPSAAIAATPPDAPSPPKVLTGKERLGPKWADEQRTDNCKVPLDKRGDRPRPDTCPGGFQ